ncbi:hypothetical protein BS50DRAFT_577697 [Corynespora cassiicola Philippines]|uniref:Uncharacterized protein n=1 Tax=Corynespora cassiicola Philippines TaxID=1448308 RepID=A0A2T2NCN1_CORCC|nr:hypothetical protein BS50DRAFT_577697 [Corynespora cassiicola Philippines]
MERKGGRRPLPPCSRSTQPSPHIRRPPLLPPEVPPSRPQRHTFVPYLWLHIAYTRARFPRLRWEPGMASRVVWVWVGDISPAPQVGTWCLAMHVTCPNLASARTHYPGRCARARMCDWYYSARARHKTPFDTKPYVLALES